MSRATITSVLAISLLCAANAVAQQAPTITASLAAVVPIKGAPSLRWSPKGATVALAKQRVGLGGSFSLGLAGSAPVLVRIAKTSGAVHYNTLWVDANRDGKLTDDEKITITPTVTRDKWWSTFDAVVSVPVPAHDGHPATTRAYPLSLWYVDDPQEPEAKPVLRWSRRGWHAGQVEIDGKPAYVLITEMEMDGRFDQRDSWAISRDSIALLKASPHQLDEHAWLDGVAYRPTQIDESGGSLSFVKIDPGTTEAEETSKRDIYLPDRNVERTKTPIAFGKELPAVLKQAARENKRVLVDFEAVWCGPCHIMDTLVFTAQSVVTAATDVIPVKVDGDDHRDLKKFYKVDGFPTLILLGSDGKEIRRGVGYQSVKEMIALLRP